MSMAALGLPDEFYKRGLTWAQRIGAEFGYSEAGDLLHDVIEYLIEHPKMVTDFYYTDTKVDPPVERFGWSSCQRDCTRLMADRARRDKRAATGTDERDEFSYANKQIATLLPYVWHSSVLAAGQEPEEGPRAAVDQSKGFTAQAMILDLKLAYANTVHPGSQWDEIAKRLYFLQLTQQECADAMGIDRLVVQRRNQAMLEAIGISLNGTPGYSDAYKKREQKINENYEPGTTLGDGPGSRQAMSNATAQALNDY